MPKVLFLPSGKVWEIRAGVSILAAANRARLPVGQSCNGDGICGWCKVKVVHGTLGPASLIEKKLMEEKQFAPDERAACLAPVEGDVAVTTSYW
jgi:ferredoxin, 2Fe-2S